MRLGPILKILLDPKGTHEEIVHLSQRLTRVTEERERLQKIFDGLDVIPRDPPGHFYSPVPSRADVEEHLARLQHKEMLAELPAIRTDDHTQLDFLTCLQVYYPKVPFQARPVEGWLYYFDNPHYSYTDVIVLFCAMNHLLLRQPALFLYGRDRSFLCNEPFSPAAHD
jgi:hypothetical protein